MKLTSTIFVGLFLLLGTAALAQQHQAQEPPPKADVFLVYSYLRFNPTLPAGRNRSFNGGGGGFTFFVGKYFGVKGEFMGYASTTFTTTVIAPVTTDHGTIPVGTFRSQGNMFTYMFGPVVRLPGKVTPFAEVLFGGSNTNAYTGLIKSINLGGGTLSATGTQHPFTMAYGGGLDVNVYHHVAIRPVEIDYVLTRYSNPFTGTNNQNNFRYLGGVVLNF
jgi:hypothetical protein